MRDRNGNLITPGCVVFEVGSTASVPPLVVLADNRLLSLGGADTDEFPCLILPAGEISPYDLMIVDPDTVDFGSYA